MAQRAQLQQAEAIALSVAVCTRDRPDWCFRAVSAVASQLDPRDELIIVDQSDSESTREALTGLVSRCPVRWIASGQRGLSAARNEAIVASANEIVVFIDDDCIPESGWLDEWRAAATYWHDEIGIAFGRVVCAPFDPTKGSIAGFEPDPGIHGAELFQRPAGAAGMGANMAVKRTSVHQVLGFDETLGSGGFFGAGEELDLAYRLARTGHLIAHLQSPVVQHHGYRPYSAGSALTLRYAFGIAATFTKHARCGDTRAMSMLAREIMGSLGYIAQQMVHGRRPLGVRRLGSYVRGILAASRWPIERQRRLFAMRPGHVVDQNPQVVPLSSEAIYPSEVVRAAARRQVVLFTSSYCMGGIEAHIIDLAGGLKRREWDVALICSTLRDIEPLRDEMSRIGVTVHAIPHALNPFQLIHRAWRLITVLRRYRGSVVHLHLQGESGGMLPLVAARASGAAAVVRTLHNPPVLPLANSQRFLVRTTERWLDRIISVSSETMRAQEEEFRRDPRKSVIIPNGVDLDRFSALISKKKARKEWNIPLTDVIVGTVARLQEERKGISEFIEMSAAVARCWPQSRFLVVGDGPLRPKLERQAQELGVSDRFLFTGFRRDVPRLLAAMDVAVFPSSYEAGPYVMLEAMAMGCPVVITPTGLAIDLIKPGITGMLVPFHDRAALFMAVHHLLSNPALARRIGEAGRQVIVNGYSADVMVDSIVRVYQEVGEPAASAPIRDQASLA
jgi:glycosyltransferase involved in cell wall biosynthesis/GT2 family glycosyltransferase